MTKFIIENLSDLSMYAALELVQITIKSENSRVIGSKKLRYYADFSDGYAVSSIENKGSLKFWVYKKQSICGVTNEGRN